MTGTRDEIDALFGRWKEEHRHVDAALLYLTDWFHQQGTVLSPPFVLATAKLSELRAQLEGHFAKEDELVRLLGEARGSTTMEIESVRRQTEREHATIISRISELITNLGTAQAEFDSWETATRDFELLVDLLEQHEEQEAATVGWLLP